MDSHQPTLRRMKTYTGGQGYVYQYYFVGQRPAPDRPADAGGTEYIFDVTADRKTTFSVSVFLAQRLLEAWTKRHRRALTTAEQYGAVKMRLFQAFDEIENMMADGRQLSLSGEDLDNLLATLGVA